MRIFRRFGRKPKRLLKALRGDPTSVVLRLRLAAAYREVGRDGDAVALYYEVALAYRAQGRLGQAIAVCESALEVAPSEQKTKELLAELQGVGASAGGSAPMHATVVETPPSPDVEEIPSVREILGRDEPSLPAARTTGQAEPLIEERAPAESADGRTPPGDVLRGPPARILQLMAVGQQTGVLSASCDSGSAVIYFRNGRVDMATGAGVADVSQIGATVGDRRQELAEALERQTRDVIFELQRWRDCAYSFEATDDVPALAREVFLSADVEAILLEAGRRVDEWYLIERDVGNLDFVFLRDEETVARLGRHRLTSDELEVLDLVDGRNRVSDIIRRSEAGLFHVSKMLYRLYAGRLIRRRAMRLPTVPPGRRIEKRATKQSLTDAAPTRDR